MQTFSDYDLKRLAAIHEPKVVGVAPCLSASRDLMEIRGGYFVIMALKFLATKPIRYI